MKRRVAFAFGVAFFAVSCVFFFRDFLVGSENADAYEAESSARKQWELLRLRDPATGKIPENIRRAELAFAATLPSQSVSSKRESLLSSEWTSRGPWNVGGRTRALAVDAGNENIVLSAGVSGGIWRSTDGGGYWNPSLTPAQMKSATCLAQDTRAGKQHVWYCGTGETWGNSSRLNGDGLLKSTDGGISWKILSVTSTGTPQTFDGQFEFVWRVATNPANATQDEVFAATTFGGIVRSTDGGATWKTMLGGLGNQYPLFTDIAITAKGVMYAALSSRSGSGGYNAVVKGMFRSTDGVNWANITPTSFPLNCDRITIGVAPSDENQVYFLANTPETGFKGIGFEQSEDWNSLWKYHYLSGNGSGSGGQWEILSQNLPNFGGEFGDFNSQTSYDLFVRVQPDNPSVVYIGGTNLYRSTDGFTSRNNTTWIGGYKPNTALPDYEMYANQHPDQHELVFLKSNPKVMISANDGGLWKCSDNSAASPVWTSLNNGYLTSQFYTVALDRATPKSNVIVGGLQDNGTFFVNSPQSTAEWVQPGLGDGSFCAIAGGGNYYLSRQTGRVGRFILDSTGTILRKGRVDPGGSGYIFIAPFLLDPNDDKVMYLTRGREILRNKDLTQIPLGTWTETQINWESLPHTVVGADNISALGMAVSPANTLYFGTEAGRVYRLNNSADTSAVPQDITGASFPKGAYISCISVDPHDGNSVIVVFSNYSVVSVFSSTDGGNSWAAIAGNLEQNANGTGNGPSCRWLKTLAVGGKTMYFIGTSIGLFSTAYLNGANTVWEQEGAGLIGNVVVDMIDARDSDGTVVVATHGGGVFSAQIASLPASPSAPVLMSPANDTVNVFPAQTFTWKSSPTAVYYQIQISEKNDFSTIFSERNAQTATSFDVLNLTQGMKTFYWRVRAFNSGGASAYSEIRQFRTAVAAPILLLPPIGSTGIETSPVLTWQSVEKANSYRVQVSPNLSFATIITDQTTSQVSYQLSGLELSKKYYWRVSAKSADGEGSLSERWNFFTGTVGVMETEQNTMALKVFPNPFSIMTNAEFFLKKTSFVQLKLYDEYGRSVASLTERQLPAGKHIFPVSGLPLAGGRYFLVLRAEEQTQTLSVEVAR